MFEIGPPPIILFVIPPIGASLTLEIDGGARIYASFTPPYFEELTLSLIGFNITNPSESQEEIAEPIGADVSEKIWKDWKWQIKHSIK